MEYTITETPFKSRTLSSFFSRLDEKIEDMEYTIFVQKEEIKELQKQVDDDISRRMREGNAMIGNILSACIGGGRIDQMGPAAAIVLDKIRNMSTVEEIHNYVNKLIEENK